MLIYFCKRGFQCAALTDPRMNFVAAQRGLALIDSLRAIFSPQPEPSPQGADTDTASEASSDKDEALFVG